ncbi:hypothetical protein KL936_000084 [Ogataea polymorpha]|nr:hypothetical protein KL936_000084 [Ogataea polymorpha]
MLNRALFVTRARWIPLHFARTVVFHRKRRPQPPDATKIDTSLSEQIKNLEKFTQQFQSIVKTKQDLSAQKKAMEDLHVNDNPDDLVDEEADALFEALMSSNSSQNPLLLEDGPSAQSLSIFPPVEPYTALPPSIREKLDPETIKHITVAAGANWVPVVDRLHQTSGLAGSRPIDVVRFMTKIPRAQRPLVVAKIHDMSISAGLLENVHIYNTIMSCYNMASATQARPIVEKLYSELQEKNIKPNLITYSVMVNLYSKLTDVDNVRKFMQQISSEGLVATKEVYTSVLQMYVRLEKYEHVLETFNTMKFLSIETAPSSRTYSSVILMDVLNNNVEHALGLYEEMVAKKLPLEPETYLALVKGCTTRRELIEKGWQFIIEYYSKGFPMDARVIEMMMALAVKDSDLNLARALFVGLFDTLTKAEGRLAPPSPVALKYLFNAYAFYDPQRVPVSRLNKQVGEIAARTFDLCDFCFHVDAPPFLPTLHVGETQALSEARALFQYFSAKFPQQISVEVLDAFLFVFAWKGESIVEFEQLWNRHTFFRGEGVTVEEPEEPKEQSVQEQLSKEPAVAAAATTPTLKYPRNDRLYNVCLHAARIHKDVRFAQKIWTERGKYRKTPEFQRLSPQKQDQQDFKFARGIVSVFTQTNNVVDAYQVVLSSQRRFSWTYYHLKELMLLAEKLGYTSIHKNLSEVAHLAEKRQRKMFVNS